MEITPRRHRDGSLRKPEAIEPHCIHPFTHDPITYQPASACRFCKDGAPLARWKVEWAAWLAENPDSPEAWVVRRMDSRP
jgi:hypothetical protein